MGHIQQIVNLIQNSLYADKNIYSNIAGSAKFDSYIFISLNKKLNAINQLNKSMVGELLKSANNIGESIDLNNYIDKIEVR